MRGGMRRLALVALVVGGCWRPPGPVHGPFTGGTTRFYVDAITLPVQRADFAIDLDGDGRTDDQLGNIYGAIVSNKLEDDHVAEIVAARAVDATVELVSDDPALRDDASVGVRWNGAPDAPGDEVGAYLHDGHLLSNRAQAAGGMVVLPLFDNADPSRVAIDHYDVQLDGDGAGGLSGTLHATAPDGTFVPAVFPALLRALEVHVDNRSALRTFDSDGDGQITLDEAAGSPLVQNLVASDVRIDGARELSLAFEFHLSRCADDACARPLPPPSCFDRVRNGDELDVDCGGACGPCWPGDACATDGDCATAHCDAGRCRAPSCADGVRDGYESDIDCGYACASCATGRHCDESTDCQSATCAPDSRCQ